MDPYVDYHRDHCEQALAAARAVLFPSAAVRSQLVELGTRSESVVQIRDDLAYIRCRRPEHARRHPNDVPIRYTERGKPARELDRLLDVKVSLLIYAYGLTDEEWRAGAEPVTRHGRIIDLRVWRMIHDEEQALYRAGLRSGPPGEYGPTGSRLFRFSRYPGLLIKPWDDRTAEQAGALFDGQVGR